MCCRNTPFMVSSSIAATFSTGWGRLLALAFAFAFLLLSALGIFLGPALRFPVAFAFALGFTSSSLSSLPCVAPVDWADLVLVLLEAGLFITGGSSSLSSTAGSSSANSSSGSSPWKRLQLTGSSTASDFFLFGAAFGAFSSSFSSPAFSVFGFLPRFFGEAFFFASPLAFPLPLDFGARVPLLCCSTSPGSVLPGSSSASVGVLPFFLQASWSWRVSTWRKDWKDSFYVFFWGWSGKVWNHEVGIVVALHGSGKEHQQCCLVM